MNKPHEVRLEIKTTHRTTLVKNCAWSGEQTTKTKLNIIFGNH